MRLSLFFLIFAGLVAMPTAATAIEDEIAKMARPCTIDAECVVFADECRVLKSILKSKLPEHSVGTKYFDKNTIIYSSDPTKTLCLRMYIRDPMWAIKNPVAKCINHACIVVSGDSGS